MFVRVQDQATEGQVISKDLGDRGKAAGGESRNLNNLFSLFILIDLNYKNSL